MFRVLVGQDFESVAVEDSHHGTGNFSERGIVRKKEDQSTSSFANAENHLRDDFGSSLPTCNIPMRVKGIVQDFSLSC